MLNIPSLYGKVSEDEWLIRKHLAASFRVAYYYGWNDNWEFTFPPVSYGFTR